LESCIHHDSQDTIRDARTMGSLCHQYLPIGALLAHTLSDVV